MNRDRGGVQQKNSIRIGKFIYTRRKFNLWYNFWKKTISGGKIQFLGIGGEWLNSSSGSFTARWGKLCRVQYFSAYLSGTFSVYFSVLYFSTVVFFWALAVFAVISNHLKPCFSVSVQRFSLSVLRRAQRQGAGWGFDQLTVQEPYTQDPCESVCVLVCCWIPASEEAVMVFEEKIITVP